MSGFVDPRKLPIASRFGEAKVDLMRHGRTSIWRGEQRRPQLIATLVESVSTVGTPQQQRAFAEQVLDGLRHAYEKGKQAQDAFAIAERLYRELWAAKYAPHLLDTRLIIDRVTAGALGLTPKLHQLSDAMDNGIMEGILAVQKMADASEKPKRGRKKRLAVEVTDLIAKAYERHFERPPARSRRGTGMPPPFLRACAVVEWILATEGRRISLGYAARLEGIKRNDIEEILAAEDRRISLDTNGTGQVPTI